MLVPFCSSVPSLTLASLLRWPQTPHASQGVTQSERLNPMVLEDLERWSKGWYPVEHRRHLEPSAREVKPGLSYSGTQG